MKPDSSTRTKRRPIFSPNNQWRARLSVRGDESALKRSALCYISAMVMLLIISGLVWSVREPDRIEKFWVFIGPMISSGLTTMGLLIRRPG